MGFIVIVKNIVSPTHEPKVGITEIVAVMSILVLFIPVKEEIFPVPLAANPIPGLLFDQLYIIPGLFPDFGSRSLENAMKIKMEKMEKKEKKEKLDKEDSNNEHKVD